MRQKYLGTDSRSDLSIGLIIIFYSVYKKSLNALIVLRIIISAFVSMNIKHDALHLFIAELAGRIKGKDKHVASMCKI